MLQNMLLGSEIDLSFCTGVLCRHLIPSASSFSGASMAVGNLSAIGQRFEKFSTPGAGLEICCMHMQLT